MDVNLGVSNGITPLLQLLSQGNMYNMIPLIDMVRYLIKMGADPKVLIYFINISI